MAINLNKGDSFDLNAGLSRVGVGLGWSPNQGSSQYDYDLDASAFMLGANRKVPEDEFFVFYNNTSSPDGAVETSGDDQTGGGGGDDETLSVDLTKVDARIKEIVFVVTIHDHELRRQTFGQVRGSFIRIYNAVSGEEIAKYELDEDFSVETAVEFGRLYRQGRQWRFEALGIGYKGGLQTFVSKYA